jgi:hypothetical protein
MKLTRSVVFGLLAIAGYCIGIAFLHSLNHPSPPPDPPNVVNDVARLNRTVVHKVVSPTEEKEIRDAVLNAAAKGEKVTIAGKRHSIGGQTIYAGAVALDMLHFNKILALDETNKILTVQSGATWSNIQEFLNPRGLGGAEHERSQCVHGGRINECECSWLGYATWTGRSVSPMVSVVAFGRLNQTLHSG